MSKMRQMPLGQFPNLGAVIDAIITSASCIPHESDCIHLVLDSYIEMSLKEGERMRRTDPTTCINSVGMTRDMQWTLCEMLPILPSSPALLFRMMRCFKQKLMVVQRSPNSWTGRMKQTAGCSCKTVPESCRSFQRYRHFCITATLCPIASNAGVEGTLAAVWHWRKAKHASTASGNFWTWSTTRQDSDHGTLLTGDDCLSKVGTKHAAMTMWPSAISHKLWRDRPRCT